MGADRPSPLGGRSLAIGDGHAAQVRTGRLVGWAEGQPLVQVGDGAAPAPARSMIQLDEARARALVAERREVVLLLEDGDPARPIVAGLLDAAPRPPSATPGLEAALEATLGAGPRETELDGQRLVLEAREELVLRCGEASVTLRRDGRLVIKGLYVETHAGGTNRIKGATVKIN